MIIESVSLFKTKFVRLEMMVAEIATATALQSRNSPLPDCRYVLDRFTEYVRDVKNNLKSDLYGCLLESEYALASGKFRNYVYSLISN